MESIKNAIKDLIVRAKEFFAGNIYAKGFIIVFLLFSAGYLLGNGCGIVMLKNVLLNKDSSNFLLYSPSNEFYTIYLNLNSENELQRLNGYYALFDNNLIDEEFLIERYEFEKSFLLKRTIIWLLGALKNNKEVEKFLRTKYSVSEELLQMEIIKSLKRINYERFIKFAEEKKINKEVIENF